MNKLYLKLKQEKAEIISIKDTEIGDLVQVVDDHGCADTKGHILLNTYLGIIDLYDPWKTWYKNDTLDFKVIKLKKGDKVTLTIKS